MQPFRNVLMLSPETIPALHSFCPYEPPVGGCLAKQLTLKPIEGLQSNGSKLKSWDFELYCRVHLEEGILRICNSDPRSRSPVSSNHGYDKVRHVVCK